MSKCVDWREDLYVNKRLTRVILNKDFKDDIDRTRYRINEIENLKSIKTSEEILKLKKFLVQERGKIVIDRLSQIFATTQKQLFRDKISYDCKAIINFIDKAEEIDSSIYEINFEELYFEDKYKYIKLKKARDEYQDKIYNRRKDCNKNTLVNREYYSPYRYLYDEANDLKFLANAYHHGNLMLEYFVRDTCVIERAYEILEQIFNQTEDIYNRYINEFTRVLGDISDMDYLEVYNGYTRRISHN